MSRENGHEHIPRLIQLLDSDDSAVRLAAHQALQDITGQNFGYRAWADVESRNQATLWWKRWAVDSGHLPSSALPPEPPTTEPTTNPVTPDQV